MKDSLKTIIFATVLGVVCAGLLAGASSWLKPYQEANEKAEKWRNIFDVLGVSYDKDADSHGLLRLVWDEKKTPGGVVFTHVIRTAQDANMTFYTYDHPKDGRLIAFEFSGMGLWGHIEGLLCLRGDLATVYNVAFYKQEETPGLGGEIDQPEFRGRFPGKTVAGPGKVGIRIRKPDQASGPNEVDGISSATLTCDKVEAMINKASERIIANREAILKAAAASGGVRKEAGNE